VTILRPDSGSAEVSSILVEAITETARDLAARSTFTAVRVEGSILLARAGRHTFAVRNEIRKEPSAARRTVVDLYASMVVRNLVGRVAKQGEGGG